MTLNGRPRLSASRAEQGGEVSERQLRDITGIIATSGDQLDRNYLERWAQSMGLCELYQRVMDKHD